MRDYSSPMRRRLRAARRLVYASTRRTMWRDGHAIPAFWWDGHPNFGDDLTPWLLPRYGVLPIYRRPTAARLAGVGSILEFLPRSFDGMIWGSGLLEGREHRLPNAGVLAVRGPLTAELIGLREAVPFGDPGILVSRHMRAPKKRWQLGIVPHGHHRQHEGLRLLMRRCGARACVVNVHQGAGSAVRQIASCHVVLTTSLHGLVTADAFGVPAVWTTLEPPLSGGDFKFRDYEAALGQARSRFMPFDDEVTLDDIVVAARSADAATIRVMADELEKALRRLVQATDASCFPAEVRRALGSSHVGGHTASR